jgi:hypothetical protein
LNESFILWDKVGELEDTLASLKLRRKQLDTAEETMGDQRDNEINEGGTASEDQSLLGRPQGMKPIITSIPSSQRLASLDVFRGLTIAVGAFLLSSTHLCIDCTLLI